ncbi:NAD-dependent epimerase/dehydratase family protein [Sphingomonas sp. SUN039]|uniref:NAD-dependent epimerase/dehydratase family protein n=1 Tax=Sphingomonas sp. SUN039 TaxID=2937787 RepID=UPI0021642C8E|nr:NAD-dependent epimerase/dehydratase family protein [Sphingomonas sp. SUN039]UVO52598.1 NAD-dependent epimerase/dehydratase family protein [Sphingomonas sp. SUN039]
MAGTVLVSGGSGYIAGYVIRQLVGEGWTVRTTVRNLAREAEVRRVLAVDNAKLSFFGADLESDAGWAEAMAGCSHVAHVASPFPATAPKHDDELIVPARDGALRALRAAKAAGVRRFVMTSSTAAIGYGHAGVERPYTEAEWTNVHGPNLSAYVKSKTIAERAARDWVAREGGGIEFCTVNPSLVLGPVLSADMSTSVEAVKKLLDGSVPGLPNLSFPAVDVRDIADLHVRALNAPNMAGERFIGSGPTATMADMAVILKRRLGTEARRVPTIKLPDFLVRIAAMFDPVMRQVTGELSKPKTMDASHARDKLGWKTRPIEESVVDTARSLIDLGIVKV